MMVLSLWYWSLAGGIVTFNMAAKQKGSNMGKNIFCQYHFGQKFFHVSKNLLGKITRNQSETNNWT